MTRQKNQLRIIGGQYRGRKLNFPDADGLRPTPDRVRETLFNWLMPIINGACCLDLFTGSGALGLEALSRGAASVVLVDNHPRVVKQLRENLALLGVDNAKVVQSSAVAYLDGPPNPFDVIFLDPPYHSDLLAECIERLEQNDWCAARAWIYLEVPSRQDLPSLPENWTVQRTKTAGQVGYHLIQRVARSAQSV